MVSYRYSRGKHNEQNNAFGGGCVKDGTRFIDYGTPVVSYFGFLSLRSTVTGLGNGLEKFHAFILRPQR